MKIVKVAQADGTHGKETEPAKIMIEGEIEKKGASLGEIEKYFDCEAQKIADVLIETLPQGMLEPLMVKLLQARISLYNRAMP
jgi:hypothetical protein